MVCMRGEATKQNEFRFNFKIYIGANMKNSIWIQKKDIGTEFKIPYQRVDRWYNLGYVAKGDSSSYNREDIINHLKMVNKIDDGSYFIIKNGVKYVTSKTAIKLINRSIPFLALAYKNKRIIPIIPNPKRPKFRLYSIPDLLILDKTSGRETQRFPKPKKVFIPKNTTIPKNLLAMKAALQNFMLSKNLGPKFIVTYSPYTKNIILKAEESKIKYIAKARLIEFYKTKGTLYSFDFELDFLSKWGA